MPDNLVPVIVINSDSGSSFMIRDENFDYENGNIIVNNEVHSVNNFPVRTDRGESADLLNGYSGYKEFVDASTFQAPSLEITVAVGDTVDMDSVGVAVETIPAAEHEGMYRHGVIIGDSKGQKEERIQWEPTGGLEGPNGTCIQIGYDKKGREVAVRKC